MRNSSEMTGPSEEIFGQPFSAFGQPYPGATEFDHMFAMGEKVAKSILQKVSLTK